MTTNTRTLDELHAEADKAKQIAADLAQKAHEAEDAREQARDQVRRDHATYLYDVRNKELSAAKDAAQQAWENAVGNAALTLPELFNAWLTMRTAYRVHYEQTGYNASRADQALGMAKYGAREYMHGQDRPRPSILADYSKETTWEWAVEQHMLKISDSASQAERQKHDDLEAATLAAIDNG